MSGKSLAMMPWFPRDFIASTLGWRLLDRALYRCLLDAQWELGSLPDDHEELTLIAGATPSEFAAAWPRVSSKFEAIASGRLVNIRLEEHRTKALKIKDERAEAGKRGGQASGQSRKAKVEATTKATDPIFANGLVEAKSNPPTPSPTPSIQSVVEGAQRTMTEAGEMASDLRNLGIEVSSMHPTLVAWVQEGFTLPQLHEAIERARQAKPVPQKIAANYLDSVLRNPPRGPPQRLGKFERAKATLGETKDVGFG